MTRRPPRITFITFDLVLTEPGGVTRPGDPVPVGDSGGDRRNGTDNRGGVGSDQENPVDAVLDTDVHDAPQIPGTSLAGALRQLVTGYGGPDLADRLFGRVGRDGEDGAVASPVWVFDAPTAAAAATEAHCSTGVDRRTGSARNRTLHRDEVAVAGTRFAAVLRWDDPRPADLSDLMARLAGWRPVIGRAVSRGRGRCQVENLRSGTCDLATTAGLAQWLTVAGPALPTAVATQPWTGPVAGVTVERVCRARLVVTGPLHVGSGETELRDGHEVQLLRRSGGRIVVPGSALKGLLRSRAEFILRSLDARPTPCIEGDCGTCLTCEIFGFAGRDRQRASVGRRGRIRVLDADLVDHADPVTRDHVAIDRFTGGAADGLLFTNEIVEQGHFDLVVENLACDNALRDQARALIRLVLDDLTDGLLGIGGSTTRGYGSVRLVEGSETDLPSGDQARAALRALLVPQEANR